MLRRLIRPALIAAALSACNAQPELLNSERIKERYGNYGVQVLLQDANTRRSSLYSELEGRRTARTNAVVRFVDVAALAATHDKIVAGGSIGSTLRHDGWQVRKATSHVGEIVIADALHPLAQRMRLQTPAKLAFHAYDLYADKPDNSVHYASIVETHHPDFLTADELRAIYRPVSDVPLSAQEVEALAALVLAGD